MQRATVSIILIILFYILLSCNSNNKTGIEGDDNDGNNITIGDNNVVINDGKNRIADSVEIKGVWDKQKATELVLKIIDKNYDSVINNYSHEILAFYNMEYVDKEAIIAVAFSRLRRGFDKNGSDTVHSCHACGGEMSFIEFNKYTNGWKIDNMYIRNLEEGQWGEPSSDWKLINIGYHKFGFVVQGSGTGQGYSESYTVIYSIVGGEFTEIFNVMTGFDDSGAKTISEDAYDSNIEIVKEGTGFYDLIITTKGIKEKKYFDEKNYYKFDGIKYSISNNFR